MLHSFRFTLIMAGFLGLLSRATALTITQVYSFSGTGSAQYGMGTGSFSSWELNQFNSSSGVLVSVDIAMHSVGHAGSTDVNPYSFPLGNSPLLEVWSNYTGASIFGSSDHLYYQRQPNDPLFIQPYGTVSYGMDFALDIQGHYITNLSPFIGTGTTHLSFGVNERPGSDSLGSSVSQTTVASVVYTYRIPDELNTLSMSAAVFSLLVLFHRKGIRHH